ncbi:MAG: hypothetical protein J7647_23300 [Cyanobacteria bacterium SBLK]|nr:hypothetical protein [Cyanobacteria bacterium SBLK]
MFSVLSRKKQIRDIIKYIHYSAFLRVNMKFFDALIQQFIDLCEIPELYAGIATGSIEIDIIPLGSCYYGIKVDCSDSSLADRMSLHEEVAIDAMYRSNLAETYITCRNQFVQLFPNPIFLLASMNTEEIDLNALYRSEYPVYIIAMGSEKVLFANLPALSEQEKSASDFLGSEVAPLHYPDEFEQRKRLLRLDGQVMNYEHKGMCWYQDGMFWRRREVRFVTDQKIVHFGDIECRLCIDYVTEETRRFVD